MSKAIIAKNISKQYHLGEVGTGTLRHDLNRAWHKMRGKEDPYLLLGDENDRSVKASSEYVWALKNINFEINHGDVIGILGRNGAGKSTLLKLLSRTTAPTTGEIKIKGRVASLLEVGTGFHGELSGRENIFLNGAIMGMSKQEIKGKLDEIIEFAGVEKYIDTPVKRYSSGMYVRLAFGVAAHLDPDVLIVDEVLAVGDVDFQKKALGKMKEVGATEGRTVLFVSHNMTAIKNLCPKAMYLKNGLIQSIGDTDTVMNEYLSHNNNSSLKQFFDNPESAPGNEFVKMKRMEVVPQFVNLNEPITIHTPINIEFEFWNYREDVPINLSLVLNTLQSECVFNVYTASIKLSKGLHKGVCEIPANLLNDGAYSISMMVVGEKSYSIFYFEDVVGFEVIEKREGSNWHGKHPGLVRPSLNFSLNKEGDK